ncbi:hypothetical protein COO91_09914 (plasmid) [Nostoc flagelliforme CCNUN1]|uniref:Uncharacterized protein n=1 Tax=Nostoc flagelliforme CCNUN1 TaxID=2038116 RepID=A0A2K8T7Q8_9NOSO|nr:hypothetical protein [Nostoc flagelliforme]AUB43728.1 hypothetical protein COO91_09914 [Nostoc flagelliforme CCNUN1]
MLIDELATTPNSLTELIIVNVLNNVIVQQLTAFSRVLISLKALLALTIETAAIVNHFSKTKEHRYE